MSDTSKREELIEEAAKAIDAVASVSIYGSRATIVNPHETARAALAVFEQARTPAGDAREDMIAWLLRDHGNDLSPLGRNYTDAEIAAAVRRTAVQEPITHDRDDMGICRQCGHGITARDVLDGEGPCPAPSADVRDALIEGAKLDARNSMRSDPRVWHEALEAALDKVLPSFWDAALRAAAGRIQ